MKNLSLKSTPAESRTHKIIKLYLSQLIYEKNPDITEKSLEKYICNRFADIYFKFMNGKEVVVEVQNSKISVEEMKNRTNDYNNQGIYVLWILHGKGTCVASPKTPRVEKEVKISPAESFLHKLYGGRVYYVNFSNKNESISFPYALHFSMLLNKKKRGMFKFKYSTFFYRSANYSQLFNLKLLCTEFSGHKIARFYDKNIKSQLKERILYIITNTQSYTIKDKKTLKFIIKSFKKKYGMYMILKALIELKNNQKINISHKLVKRIRKKLL